MVVAFLFRDQTSVKLINLVVIVKLYINLYILRSVELLGKTRILKQTLLKKINNKIRVKGLVSVSCVLNQKLALFCTLLKVLEQRPPKTTG